MIGNTDIRRWIKKQKINIETWEQERKRKMGGCKESERFHFPSTVCVFLSPSGEAERARDSVCPCRL